MINALVAKKFLVYGLSLILFSQLVYANIIINEVMADPLYDESLNEYIELYNPTEDPIDISEWIIGDTNDNDTIEGGLYQGNGTIINPNSYALITDSNTRVYNNFKVLYNTTKLYVDDEAIGNGLSNSGDIISLYNKNGNLIDNLTYGNTQNGKSIIKDANNNPWNAEPTPGYSNNGSFIDYYENECDWKIEIKLYNQYFDNSGDFEFNVNVEKIGGSSTEIILYRKIKDAYGNIVSNYQPKTKTAIYKTNFNGPWTPNYPPGIYFINTTIKTNCNDFNLENNCDSKFFIIKEKELEKDSEIKIEKIYLGNDNKAKWGDTIRIKVKVYRGNTGKESISLGLEQDISKKTKFNAEDKFEEYILTLPIQIDLNCNGKFEDDTYELILEGLGEKDSKEIKIEGKSNLCEKKSKSIKKEKTLTDIKKASSENADQNYEKVIYGDIEKITGETIYESSEIKAKRLAIYLFCALLILLIIFQKTRK